jgi:DNA modification methylase
MAMSQQEWGLIMQQLEEVDKVDNKSIGFHWSSTIIWAKDSLVVSRKDYHTQYEPVWYGWKSDGARVCKVEDRKQSDLWNIPRPKRSDEHPTMKPVELVARSLRNSSQPGDIVIDFFGGSGTTMAAADGCDRRSRLAELDPKYVAVTLQRWVDITGGKPELQVEIE